MSSTKLATTSKHKIAIVGLANQYPDADTPDSFWQNLLDKKDSRSTITAQKLNAEPHDYSGEQGQSDRFYCDQGGYIQNFTFNPNGYQLAPEQLAGLDDSFLWAIDTAHKALKDANIELTNPKLSRTGIVMGTLSFPIAKSNELFVPLYHGAVEKGLQHKLKQPNLKLQHFSPSSADSGKGDETAVPLANGAIAHNASKLVADALGLGAAQLSLDAACASSVYSLKLACDYLQTGKADVMLAGAVSGADPFFINMGFSIFHAYPEHGISAPFDQNSKGLFAGEGAGVLVLKRLEDAERDGDKIYALVSGIGLSNDGKGQFVLSPNSDGQVKAFERAYADTQMNGEQLNPEQIEVIECHATGTPLGDKVELTSMERFFADKLNGSNPPLIGSAKSNLGHLLTAAGMPGIMKMVFAMQHGMLPPSINISAPISSPDGMFANHTLPQQVQPWPVKTSNTHRHAGVSVFGFGGCNAHLLLESYQGKGQHLACTEKPAKPSTLAVTGIASHFGKFSNISEFATAAKNKQNAFIQLPQNRWKGLQHHHELLGQYNVPSDLSGAFIESFEFDFLRFKVPPNEDDRLISQQLLLMKVADEAIRDAQLTPGGKVAVLVAMETELELHQFRGRVNLHTQLANSLKAQGVELTADEYQALEAIAMDSVLDAAKLNQYTSFIGNIMASRISSLWDFNGPAFTISAAEQSVNRCIDVAQNLLATESDEPLEAVIIAAVDLAGSVENICLRSATMNKCSETLDQSATNTTRFGEGAGAIVLQADVTAERANNNATGTNSELDLMQQALGAVSLDSDPHNSDPQDPVAAESNVASNATSYGTIEALSFGKLANFNQVSDALLSQTDVLAQQVNTIELNQAPESQFAAAQQLSNLFSQATLQHASDCIGHTFAASGMASLQHQLLTSADTNANSNQTNNNQTIVAGISSSISEDQCSLLAMSQTPEQQAALALRLNHGVSEYENEPKQKLSLVKTVTLGGRDIYQHIVDAPLNQLASIQAKVADGLSSSAGDVTNNAKPASQVNFTVTSPMSAHRDANSEHTNLTNQIDLSMTSNTQNSRPLAQTNITTAQTNALPPAHLSAFEQNQWLAHQAQKAFLESREQGLKLADAMLKQQLAQANGQAPVSYDPQTHAAETSTAPVNVLAAAQQAISATSLRPDHANVPPYTAPIPADKPCIWNYADLVEYAEGDIAKVFGDDYAVIDNYSRRVRLPTTDYLLVSRVTKLDAQTNQYRPSSMTTEYDIPVDAPYLVDGQIPWAVAVESGQCDLMLISYLGIDFENKGERVYRLLDCTLTFLDDLPRGGDTLRYDIKINNFAKNGDTLLFFFSYECFVGDKMILKMDGGCAGFFTDKELEDGKGVIRTDDEIAKRQAALNNPNKPKFEPLLHCPQNQFDYGQIHRLLSADIGGCFGGAHLAHQQANQMQPSLCFASEKFLMIEQVSRVDVHGGAWGLGLIEGHKQLAPNHWYFPCHFKDDQVMAGSLMAEGCGQLLQFFMLHIGMHTLVQNGRFQPLENASQKVRCRGQVLPQHGELTYRMEVTEIGVSPRPYAKANIDILLNGKVVVDFQNLGVMIKEESECTRYVPDTTPILETSEGNTSSKQTQFEAASINAPLMAVEPDLSAPTNKGVIPLNTLKRR
ncbi:beta-ketoacyl synthase N-terminal-like domain-containing protein [Shewanella maritima]|uniref:hotdog fold thioesterase n=1 Tax=Shewanella maritima TaxID=2520507 RepID=UPI0026BE85B6